MLNKSALGDVITACRRVQVQLQPVAAARDRAECLACEHPEPKRSWWKKITEEDDAYFDLPTVRSDV